MEEIKPFEINKGIDKINEIVYYDISCTLCGRKFEYTKRKNPKDTIFICASCEAEINGVEKKSET